MQGAIMSEVDHLFPPFTSLERKQLAVLPGTSVFIYHDDYPFSWMSTISGVGRVCSAFHADP